ncbi:MAG: hypothetical protein V1742_03770 [Pseudomonadota bacterium]
MGRMATPTEFEDYQENGLCPYCYAEDVVEDAVSLERQIMRRRMLCTKCELRWTEIHSKSGEGYVMTGLFLDDAED